MQYVPNDTPGAAPNTFGAGNAGFQNGDPATGTQGTELDAGYLNDLLGNLMNIMAVAGIAPTAGRLADLSDAIQGMARKLQVEAVNYQILASDAGKIILFNTAGGALTATMPDVTAMVEGFHVDLRCAGPNPLTVNCTGAQQIDGEASITVGAGETSFVFGDETTWRSDARPSGVYAPGVAMIAASGNFTVPVGVSKLDVQLWGGGGGGGGDPSYGGGGSGGGYARKLCNVTPGQVIACTIGPGGGVNGGGGTTSFGSIFSATGGGPGTVYGGSYPPGAGVGGDVNVTGGYGAGYLADGVGGATPSPGGGSPFGGAGGPGGAGGGCVPGGGGGGNSAAAPGRIIIRW